MKYLFVPLLFLMACARPKPLPIYGEVPDFELTAQMGNQLSRKDLQGKVWVADFIYTTCTGPCPLMTQKMRSIQAAQPEIRLVSFSVDPEHDTPATLATYAAASRAKSNWYFLTGDPKTLQMLSREAFKLSDLGLTHSTRFVLVDENSRIRGYYTDFPELIADIRRLKCCRP